MLKVAPRNAALAPAGCPALASDSLFAGRLLAVGPLHRHGIGRDAGDDAAVALASNLFLSVPLHEKMANSPTADIGARLVRTNWPRTVAWTLRGVLTFVMLVQAT